MKKLLFTLLTLLLMTSLFAVNVSTVQDGLWDNDNTWDNSYPGCYDTIFVNHDVTLDYQETFNGCSQFVLIINTDLIFDGGKMKLPEGSELYLNNGANIISIHNGNADLIQIGSNKIWNGKDGTITGPDYSNGDTHLPVEFLSMFYDCSRRTLTWETMTETNNDYFIIRLGKDYSHGQLISHSEIMIPGNGNSNHHITYIESLASNHDYIELIQVDYDSTRTYLGTEYSDCSDEDTLIVGNIFPNPATENQIITLPDVKNVQIYDMLGKEVYAEIIDNKIIGLSSGFYIIVLNNNYKIKLIIR